MHALTVLFAWLLLRLRRYISYMFCRLFYVLAFSISHVVLWPLLTSGTGSVLIKHVPAHPKSCAPCGFPVLLRPAVSALIGSSGSVRLFCCLLCWALQIQAPHPLAGRSLCHRSNSGYSCARMRSPFSVFVTKLAKMVFQPSTLWA